jgi:hypothetical protein
MMGRYYRSGGWGQIVGPHGTGKSTLVHWLARQLEAISKPVLHVSVGQPCRRVGFPVADWREVQPPMQLIVDGFQQLAWWQRARVITQCRWRKVPLIITAHRSFGLTTLLRTEVTLGVAHAIVDRLLDSTSSAAMVRDRTSFRPIRPDARRAANSSLPYPPPRARNRGGEGGASAGKRSSADRPNQSIPGEEIERHWTRHGGNMREILFSLYDRYEQMRRGSSSADLVDC